MIAGKERGLGPGTFVGVDVSGEWFDIAVVGRGNQRVRHDSAGIDELVSSLVAEGPVLVVMEAAGGLERALACALLAAGVPLPSLILGAFETSPEQRAGWRRR